MGFTTSYWQKERWSRRAADTLTSYGRCWNSSLGNREVNRRSAWNTSRQNYPSLLCSIEFSLKRRVVERHPSANVLGGATLKLTRKKRRWTIRVKSMFRRLLKRCGELRLRAALLHPSHRSIARLF